MDKNCNIIAFFIDFFRVSADTAERQEKLQGSESFLLSLHFLAKEAASMYKNMNHCSHRLQTDGRDGSAGLSFQCAVPCLSRLGLKLKGKQGRPMLSHRRNFFFFSFSSSSVPPLKSQSPGPISSLKAQIPISRP